jgi:hypothetical protein
LNNDDWILNKLPSPLSKGARGLSSVQSNLQSFASSGPIFNHQSTWHIPYLCQNDISNFAHNNVMPFWQIIVLSLNIWESAWWLDFRPDSRDRSETWNVKRETWCVMRSPREI